MVCFSASPALSTGEPGRASVVSLLRREVACAGVLVEGRWRPKTLAPPVHQQLSLSQDFRKVKETSQLEAHQEKSREFAGKLEAKCQ